MKIIVAARSSNLSRAQVLEVEEELRSFHSDVQFECVFVNTTGDINKTQSLRTLGKTDFFTKEVDELVLQKKCQIAIHSAKDLPDPLPKGLGIVALTKGKDSRDVLVLRPNETIKNLKTGSIIATSSVHREESVKQLRQDFTFVDLRGTIEERIALLQEGKVDGVVVAECALIRLKLQHLNRLFLPGKSTPLQGRLAIVARAQDHAMQEVFKHLDLVFDTV